MIRARLAKLERLLAARGFPPETIAAALHAVETGKWPADGKLAETVADLRQAISAIDDMMTGPSAEAAR